MPHLLDVPTRNLLVAEAVLELLRMAGPEGVTMRNVAGQAGISLGALRENWPTRESVLTAAVWRVRDVHGVRFRHALFSRRTRDATFLAHAFLPRDDEAVLLDRAWEILSCHPGLSDRARSRVAEDRLGRRVQCSGTIVEMLGSQPDELDVRAAWLHALLDGLCRARCAREDQMTADLAERMVQESVDVVVAGVTSHNPPRPASMVNDR